MLRSALHLQGYRIDAVDGEIGSARDLYFDDAQWTVRYLVADTGDWLPGRRVLISPSALSPPDWSDQVFPVTLTREQIENGPSVAADRPVSRQIERDLIEHFDWPAYWAPGIYAPGTVDTGAAPPPARPVAADTTEGDRRPPDNAPQGDPHLRSVREVAGYRVATPDNGIGHIEDFIVDDADWVVRYVIVDTRNWLPGRKVILAPDWFAHFDWAESKAFTELPKARIEKAPDYDPAEPVNRDFEGRLYDYYGRRAYWSPVGADEGAWRI